MATKLIDLAVSLPRIVVTYLDAYTELIARDADLWQRHQLGRLARLAILFACGVLALVFAGVAVMLWATTGEYSWTLWTVPLMPVLIAIVIFLLKTDQPQPRFDALRRQFAADLHLLEEIL